MNTKVLKEVSYTSHIKFDSKCKTFRLYSGESLYAFCITPELNLEHLYWGPRLQPSFDLRYLSQSSRMAHFDTVEAPSLSNLIDFSTNNPIIIDSPCTLEDIEKTWKQSREQVHKFASLNIEINDELVTHKRLENYSWRIMNSQLQAELRSTLKKSKFNKYLTYAPATSIPSPKIKSSPIPGEVIQPTTIEVAERNFSPVHTRRRSASLPETPIVMKCRRNSSVDANDLKFYEDSPLSISSIASLQSTISTEKKNNVNKLNPSIRQTFDRKLGVIGKGTLCMEYSDYGTGDFRSPSLSIIDTYSGSSIAPLKYKRHKIFRGKVLMKNEHMPQVRSNGDDDASTLIVTVGDSYTGLEVDLYYGNIEKKNLFLMYSQSFF